MEWVGEEGVIPDSGCYFKPPSLARIAALKVARCLIYEDEDCYHYRWDPVNIWQYELPAPRKKKSKNLDPDDSPPLAWRDLAEFSSWWRCRSPFGGPKSALRGYIADAFEVLSYSGSTNEEHALFFLLRLCVSVSIDFTQVVKETMPYDWCIPLSKIIKHLGPLPLRKLTVLDNTFYDTPLVLAIIQNSPRLTSLHINVMDLNVELLRSLGSQCPNLQDIKVPGETRPSFMYLDDNGLFQGFFGNMPTSKVVECYEKKTQPRRSFRDLQLVDIPVWKDTELFFALLCFYYPRTHIGTVNVSLATDQFSLLKPFLDYGATLNVRAVNCRTNDLLEKKLKCPPEYMPYLREIRIHIDDMFEDNVNDHVFEQKLEEAGQILHEIVCQWKDLETIAVQLHEDVDALQVLQPSLHLIGKQLTTLRLSYAYSPIDIPALYQIINLCPNLQTLQLHLYIWEEQLVESSRTKLEQNTSLETLVVQQVFREAPKDQSQASCIYTIVIANILKVTPNLKTLGVACWSCLFDKFLTLYSHSIQILYLNFTQNYWQSDNGPIQSGCCSSVEFVRAMLPRFPNIEVLYVESVLSEREWHQSNIWHSGLTLKLRCPDFYHLPLWDCSVRNTEYRLYVM
ncbi:uncharacterized protein LOC143019576 isoform X2 [Oratosquilla oratoria]|uniref:uncharacterized protein LOC143019576 isoform X2 n=1 Tax=Oratosquilla oratoria TaxID=337810 RepID=UPI003F760C51